MTDNSKMYERVIDGPFEPDDPIYNIRIRQVDLLHYARSVGKKPTELSEDEIGQFVEGGYEVLKKYRGF